MGAVAVGKRADLLLLNGNPLVDVGVVQRRSGVMVRGRWFTEGELQAALEAIAAPTRSCRRQEPLLCVSQKGSDHPFG